MKFHGIRLGRSAPPFPIPEFSSRFIVQKYIECRERNKKGESTIFFQQIFLCLFLLRGISIFEIGSGGKMGSKEKTVRAKGGLGFCTNYTGAKMIR